MEVATAKYVEEIFRAPKVQAADVPKYDEKIISVTNLEVPMVESVKKTAHAPKTRRRHNSRKQDAANEEYCTTRLAALAALPDAPARAVQAQCQSSGGAAPA